MPKRVAQSVICLGRVKLTRPVQDGHKAWVYVATRPGSHIKDPTFFSRDGHEEAASIFAVKIDFSAEKQFLKKEFTILQQLGRHANIIQMREFCKFPWDGGDMFTGAIMPLYKSDLLQFLNKERPTRRAVADILLQVADALRYVHKHNIVHGDVKCENILIGRICAQSVTIKVQMQPEQTPQKRLKRRSGHAVCLADFNSAIHLADPVVDQPLENGHTLSYCAPEFLSGHIELISPAADIFSFGCVMHAAVHGTMVFGGQNLKLHLWEQLQLHNTSHFPVKFCATSKARGGYISATGKVDDVCFESWHVPSVLKTIHHRMQQVKWTCAVERQMCAIDPDRRPTWSVINTMLTNML
ncbi:protein kinase [bacterium]|nr:protein kinase [bacterium]